MVLEWDDAEVLVRGKECHREGVGQRSARSVLPSRMCFNLEPSRSYIIRLKRSDDLSKVPS